MSWGAYLVDTHVLLWDMNADPRLSRHHAEIMASDAAKFVSSATLWEIAIKASAGKLSMPHDFLRILEESEVDLLPVLPAHAMRTATLPLHHRDPFDRMLIAQAQVEKLTVLTSDRHFQAYDIDLV